MENKNSNYPPTPETVTYRVPATGEGQAVQEAKPAPASFIPENQAPGAAPGGPAKPNAHQAPPAHEQNPQYGGFPPPPHFQNQERPPKQSIFEDGNPSAKTLVAFALAIVSIGGLTSRVLALYNLVVGIVALVLAINENKLNKTRLGQTAMIIAAISVGFKALFLVACVSCLACVGCGGGLFDGFRELLPFNQFLP